MPAAFEPWLRRWRLVPDGDPIATPTGGLLPVRQEGRPAMLKLSRSAEERRGGAVLDWWDGAGAAAVLAREGDALLIERALAPRSLTQMAQTGRDEEACRILCATAARLHAPRQAPPPRLVPLAAWFAALEPAARAHAGWLAPAAAAAGRLLAEPREVVVLHGDLHHGNLLDFRERGWLAIDPKGLAGERGFDFANLFTNPDLADPTRPVAADPAAFARRLDVVAAAATLDPERLLLWILAWCGLSTAWFLADGAPPAVLSDVAALAAARLGM